jgi:hypothetical protein
MNWKTMLVRCNTRYQYGFIEGETYMVLEDVPGCLKLMSRMHGVDNGIFYVSKEDFSLAMDNHIDNVEHLIKKEIGLI